MFLLFRGRDEKNLSLQGKISFTVVRVDAGRRSPYSSGMKRWMWALSVFFAVSAGAGGGHVSPRTDSPVAAAGPLDSLQYRPGEFVWQVSVDTVDLDALGRRYTCTSRLRKQGGCG